MKNIKEWLKEYGIYLLIGFMIGVTLSIMIGCSDKDFLSGNIYQYSEEESNYTVRFADDTMHYVFQTSDTVITHISAYKLIPENDSLYLVFLEKTPDWWGLLYEWQIVKTDYGFYSAKTLKKYYKK